MRIWKSQVRYWLIFFLLANFLFEQDGATNASSRHALLMSLAEEGSFQIDAYSDYTVDWAQTPDGHFYSNKAPGPAFFAFPLFKIFDSVTSAKKAKRAERDKDRRWRAYSVLKGLSFLLQAVPFAWLVAVAVEWLESVGVSLVNQHLATLALLFGSTASLFMNTFFGHGVAAAASLGTALAFVKRRAFLLGVSGGALLLSDYGGLLCLIPLGVFLIFSPQTRWTSRELKNLALGALPFGILWAWYHTTCFGAPWTLPNKFQNPIFLSDSASTPPLWGALTLLPDPRFLWNLLFSPERGLWWTQSWVLWLTVGVLALARKAPSTPSATWLKVLGPLSLSGFALLLWMNASFNGWHGGHAPGPRYLSVGLPPLALCLGLYAHNAPKMMRVILWIGVLLSTLFCGLVLATKVHIPYSPLWPYYLKRVLGQALPTEVLRASLFMVFSGFGLFLLHRKIQIAGARSQT